MFQCYLDDSGTSGLPIVTMAGFVAYAEKWKEIEPELDAVLTEAGVPLFHSKEFHGTKPPFKNWSKTKKRKLIGDLFSAAEGCLFGLSATVRKSAIVEANKTMRPMSPLCVCFSIIMTLTDRRTSEAVKARGISFLVESGNPSNRGIEQFFYEMTQKPEFHGCLKSISFIAKGSCRAIQIADIFLFYSRRMMRDHDRFSGRLALPVCAILEIIERHGPVWYGGSVGPVENVGRLSDLGLSGLQALTTRRPAEGALARFTAHIAVAFHRMRMILRHMRKHYT